MSKCIITVGVSGSGKSTWAREYAKANNAIISNRDDLRFSLSGKRGWKEYTFPFDNGIERIVTRLQEETISEARRDIIVADTNLNWKVRQHIYWHAYNNGFDVEIQQFPITLDEALYRDTIRPEPERVGESVIRKQYDMWLKYLEVENGTK